MAVGNAAACQICVPLPTETLADRLLESDTVVLAREDPRRPYHYAAVETLKGDPGITAIDVFMNTPARRQLAGRPTSAMLLARHSKSGEWRTLGISDNDYERVARRILSFEDRWTPGETNNGERLHEFAPLLGDQDLRLHELAYLEIGRAPYKLIKSISVGVSLKRVRAMLGDPRYLEWRGLDVLLLGFSDVQKDRDRVVTEVQERQSRAITVNLDAWATAYIEIQGADAIDQIAEWYFRDATRTHDELRHIIRAFSVHASNESKFRAPVIAAYRDLIGAHPHAAPDITRDLMAWRAWDLAPELQRLEPRISEHDPLGAYVVKLYLQRAKARESLVEQEPRSSAAVKGD